MNFNYNILSICKTAGSQAFELQKILMKTFTEVQFITTTYAWLHQLHERTLRSVYNDQRLYICICTFKGCYKEATHIVKSIM